MEMENRLTEDATAVTGLPDQEGSITGEGKHYSTYFRMYDADFGRWWSQDPVTHPFQSPYTAFDNNPVLYIDPLGADSKLDNPLVPADRSGADVGGGNISNDMIQNGSSTYDPSQNFLNNMQDMGNLTASADGSQQENSTQFINASDAPSESYLASDTKSHIQTVPGQYSMYYLNYPYGASYSYDVVDNNVSALWRYYNGDGSPAIPGPVTVAKAIRTARFQENLLAIVKGDAKFIGDDLSIDMESSMFHMGRTKVTKITNCVNGDCYTIFTLFAGDGFWDVDYLEQSSDFVVGKMAKSLGHHGNFDQSDNIGPNYELYGGTVYHYIPVQIIMYYKGNYK